MALFLKLFWQSNALHNGTRSSIKRLVTIYRKTQRSTDDIIFNQFVLVCTFSCCCFFFHYPKAWFVPKLHKLRKILKSVNYYFVRQLYFDRLSFDKQYPKIQMHA